MAFFLREIQVLEMSSYFFLFRSLAILKILLSFFVCKHDSNFIEHQRNDLKRKILYPAVIIQSATVKKKFQKMHFSLRSTTVHISVCVHLSLFSEA
jgi:hypothetical protein